MSDRLFILASFRNRFITIQCYFLAWFEGRESYFTVINVLALIGDRVWFYHSCLVLFDVAVRAYSPAFKYSIFPGT